MSVTEIALKSQRIGESGDRNLISRASAVSMLEEMSQMMEEINGGDGEGKRLTVPESHPTSALGSQMEAGKSSAEGEL
jgi:hypothetical protein